MRMGRGNEDRLVGHAGYLSGMAAHFIRGGLANALQIEGRQQRAAIARLNRDDGKFQIIQNSIRFAIDEIARQTDAQHRIDVGTGKARIQIVHKHPPPAPEAIPDALHVFLKIMRA